LTDNINILVAKAQNGDKLALEQLVSEIQAQIYHLSMRMLVDPEQALDATQEILIILITKLSTFEHASKFQTWVYRVATNYLINSKKAQTRDMGLSFPMFGQMLETDLDQNAMVDPAPSPDQAVLLNELRISCTMAMLLCLDLKHRVAYVLGDILELEHNEAADILNITSQNYRKRLSRARNEVIKFTAQKCGIANDNAKCSCPARLPDAIKNGRVNASNIAYAQDDAPDYLDVLKQVNEVVDELKVFKLQNATPNFKPPEDLAAKVKAIVETA
jgi:RNA polymerase sigma factor (sigma-70 family)